MSGEVVSIHKLRPGDSIYIPGRGPQLVTGKCADTTGGYWLQTVIGQYFYPADMQFLLVPDMDPEEVWSGARGILTGGK